MNEASPRPETSANEAAEAQAAAGEWIKPEVTKLDLETAQITAP